MHLRDQNNVGRAAQTDPTLLRYSSAITEQKKCWELLAQSFTGFKLCAATPNNTQHLKICKTCNGVPKLAQHVTSKNIENCWPTM